jgi:hypothetical protein
MINLFVKRTTTVESQRIAQILGPIGANKDDFRRRVHELYSFLWPGPTSACDDNKVRLFGTHKLRVQIKHASGLPKMDRYGSIDPYCTIELAGKFERTTTKQNTYEPSWDGEYFVFDVDHTTLDSKELLALKIKVMDWDRLGKNELVGEVEIHPQKIEHILNSEAGYGEILDLDVKIVGVHVLPDDNKNCCFQMCSANFADEGLLTSSPSFQIQVEIKHLETTLIGSEIAKLKEFAMKYDADQVIVSIY